jgi:hypothetical protein
MECVLLKMGVDQDEFTDPSGGGRIQMYLGNGVTADTSTPAETALVPDQASDTTILDQYDQVIFPCWGEDPIASVATGSTANVKTVNQQANVVSYTNNGGRVFATHLSYSWLYFDPAFNPTATWIGDPAGGDPDLEYATGTANIAQPSSSADVNTFYKWMNALSSNGALSGAFSIVDERNNFSAIGAGSELWMNVSSAASPIADDGGTYPTSFPVAYTFNTPYSTATPPPTQCGKVVYSDFHVSVIAGGVYSDNGMTFPNECTPDAMSAQEKALEYLIWDLGSCLQPPPPPSSCTPKTCTDLGIGCGPAGDGCGAEIQCGDCTLPETCGGGGTPSQCGDIACKPETCNGQGIECGPAGDGCGNQIDCGQCASPLTCGGGGHPGACGSIDAGATCVPESCPDQGIKCGPAGDGCGNKIDCGTCPTGQACGAGGSGVCGPVCTPQTCAGLGYSCGPAGDGCGNEIQCGSCTLPQTCGGGGKAGVCGGGSTPSK